VTNILDEDNMASDSATALATQQSIKAYVDSQISANNDLSEVLANGNTTGGTDIVVSTGDSVQVTDLTASVAVFTDASKNLVSNAITGTGNVVMSTSPTLVTPALGTPASGVVTNLTGTASININGTVGASTASSGAFTTLTTSSVTNLAGLTASTALALDASKNVVSVANTGTGSNVLNTSPTLVTPALGTPSALVGTNITGTAAGLTAGNVTTNANLTGAVTSVGNATSLGSFTSAQLATALTDETGTGANVFATSPTLVTPALGTPSSGVVTNLTGTASININGTVGATTAAAGAFTTVTATGSAVIRGTVSNVADETVLTLGQAGGENGKSIDFVNAFGSLAKITGTKRGAGSLADDGKIVFSAAVNAVLQDVATISSAGLAVTGAITANSAAATAPFIASINGGEAMRIDSAGNVGIGGTNTNNARLALVNNSSTNTYTELHFRQTYAPAVYSSILTNFGGTLVLYADKGNATPGTSNIVFSLSNSERMRIDSSGNLMVGKTSNLNTVVGTQIAPIDGLRVVTDASTFPVIINRQTTDGALIDFRQANASEGSISVSGTTVSYNGGHLSRWAQTTTAKDDTLVKGTVLSNLDEMNVYTDVDGNPVENEQLNKIKVSDVEGDANVAGVFVNWTHDDAHDVDEINMAMTGDMIIRIASGTTVARGDLLMSAGDGTAKSQGDDIVRSKTIAKVTSTNVTCTYADGSFCVPCVLMAC